MVGVLKKALGMEKQRVEIVARESKILLKEIENL
jgi:hypothetical protein